MVYVTNSQFDAYWADRGSPATATGASEADKTDAIRQATYYLDDVYGHRFRGQPATIEQTLAWPRSGVVDGDDGSVYLNTVYPRKLRDATCEIALRVLAGTTLLPDIAVGGGSATSSSISVGPLSISETHSGGVSTRPRFPVVDMKLRGLLIGMAGSFHLGFSR